MPDADLGFCLYWRGILRCAELLGWLSIYNCFLSLVYFTMLIFCFRQLWIPWDGDGPPPDLALPPATSIGISILSHASLPSLDDVPVPRSPRPNPELLPKCVRFHLLFHPIEHPITAVFNLGLVHWWYTLNSFKSQPSLSSQVIRTCWQPVNMPWPTYTLYQYAKILCHSANRLLLPVSEISFIATACNSHPLAAAYTASSDLPCSSILCAAFASSSMLVGIRIPSLLTMVDTGHFCISVLCSCIAFALPVASSIRLHT